MAITTVRPNVTVANRAAAIAWCAPIDPGTSSQPKWMFVRVPGPKGAKN